MKKIDPNQANFTQSFQLAGVSHSCWAVIAQAIGELNLVGGTQAQIKSRLAKHLFRYYITANKPNVCLIYRSQQFATNFTNGFSAQIPAQQIQTVPLVSPVPQSPNGQIPSMQPTIQPIQLIEYNGVPTIVFGAVYDQLYYSTQPSYVPSPTLPPTTIAPSFTYQAVAPQTPPLNGGSLTGQHFFPTHVEIIGQPQH